MHSSGINGEGESSGQLANPGSTGNWPLNGVCVCVCVCVCREHWAIIYSLYLANIHVVTRRVFRSQNGQNALADSAGELTAFLETR